MARAKKSPRITRTAHAGGETISVSQDPLAAARRGRRLPIMASQTHGAHKGNRYARRREGEETRAVVRHREFDL